MSYPIQFKTHPFRFLLYLEWVLVLIVALIEALPDRHPQPVQIELLTLGCIIGFSLMGLKLPTGSQSGKILYTALEIGLLTLAEILGRSRFLPFLYLILVTRSCLLFELPGRLTVTGLSFSLFSLTLFDRFRNTPIVRQERFVFVAINFALSFGLALMFVLLLMNAVLIERKSREKLAIANQRLRQYALRIEDQATLQERNRIAREIHDSLGHSLTALNIQLEGALKLWQLQPAKAQVLLTEAKKLSSTALQDVRQSVSVLRSDPLQGRTLESALAQLLHNFEQTTGIRPASQLNLSQLISPEISTAVYRIAQEALTNIYKHGAATRVEIHLWTSRAMLYFEIRDNGKGFKPEQNSTGFGLQGMHERAAAIGGELRVKSQPGSGSIVSGNFPLSEGYE